MSKDYSMPKFDMAQAIKLAGISDAAYHTPKTFTHKLRALDMPHHKFKLISKDNAQAYIIWTDSEVIIAWRGTEPGEYKDVMADLKFRKKTSKFGGNVHRGFKGYVDKIYNEVEKEVLKLIDKKWCNIYVTGHSLGGASALICTNRLEEKFHVRGCYTYGSPRPGGWKYSRSFKSNVYRIRNNNDIVTKVPPFIFGYKHVGKLCYIDRKGVLRTGRVAFSVLFKNWVWGQLERLGDGLRDHSMGEYFTKLKNAKRNHKS
jgi:triacylglycerol lipase